MVLFTMSADLHVLRPNVRPSRPVGVRVPSSAPLGGRQSSDSTDSRSTSSSADSTSSHRNKRLLNTYHNFAMQIFHPGGQDLENAFLSAARDGDLEQVENLLQRRSHEIININAKEKQTGNTPVLFAASNGHAKIVQLLLRYGADVTIRNHNNETALEVTRQRSIRRMLLESVDRAGCTPRHLLQAAWQGDMAVVQRLLSESKVLDINCRNADGVTPLLLVIRDVDLFEQVGAILHDYNPQGVVRELLEHRADSTASDNEGRTPLHLAASYQSRISEELAAILMMKAPSEVLEMRDRRLLTPIHSASQSGQVEILVALLDGGVDVNARGYAGATPLHVSAFSGQLQTSTKLLEHGADITLVDDSGNTPVDVAKTRKLKHALREAWTEATQHKRDIVLTPVKPPSRMTVSRCQSLDDGQQDPASCTPKIGSAITPENRIIHNMTEAHKTTLAEVKLYGDMENGCHTPSLSPRKLGLPRATSRNGPTPIKLPVPPKTPRVTEHSPHSSSDKAKKTPRSLISGRQRMHTIPGGESTLNYRYQRPRAHPSVAKRNSDPVSKVTSESVQVPVTVVGLDLDEHLRDVRFQRLVSGPVAPFLGRRASSEIIDALTVNPTPPTERRGSIGRRGSNPSVMDLTGACVDYIRKGCKYLHSSSFVDDPTNPPSSRLPVRGYRQSAVNADHVPDPNSTHFFNFTSSAISPSICSIENIQETTFKYDRKNHYRPQCSPSSDLFDQDGNESILDRAKAFRIETTRIKPSLQHKVSPDSGKGSQTPSNSVASSSTASILSTPSPLQRQDANPHISKSPIKNRLGINMTPSATTAKERPYDKQMMLGSSGGNKGAIKKMDTRATAEVPLSSAKTSVQPQGIIKPPTRNVNVPAVSSERRVKQVSLSGSLNSSGCISSNQGNEAVVKAELTRTHRQSLQDGNCQPKTERKHDLPIKAETVQDNVPAMTIHEPGVNHKTRINSTLTVEYSTVQTPSRVKKKYLQQPRKTDLKSSLKNIHQSHTSKIAVASNADLKTASQTISEHLADGLIQSVSKSQPENDGIVKSNIKMQCETLQDLYMDKGKQGIEVNKIESPFGSVEMPKVSPRPGFTQDAFLPVRSAERASPGIQTSKGEPSLSKSFGSGSSITKNEIRNVVNGSLHREEQINNYNKQSTDEQRDDASSDEGVGSSVPDSQNMTKPPKRMTSSFRKKAPSHSPADSLKSLDSVGSIEDVYSEVAFISEDEIRGPRENSLVQLSEAMKIQTKKSTGGERGWKNVRKASGKSVAPGKLQPRKQLKEIDKSVLKAVGISFSETNLKGHVSPSEKPKPYQEQETTKDPKSPGLPNPKPSMFHWSKFKSPETSPRSDSSVAVSPLHHDPRVIKEHTPVIVDIMECMQNYSGQAESTLSRWKPKKTSGCLNSESVAPLSKMRRKAVGSKEPPARRPVAKGSFRKVGIVCVQKGCKKTSKAGNGGTVRQAKKKQQDMDATASQKKIRRVKPKIVQKLGSLHQLSASDTSTRAFITGKGWHIQTEKNETGDVILHDNVAHYSSADDSSPGSSTPKILPQTPIATDKVAQSPELSPHNTLMLNELGKSLPLSSAVISNIANIMSPLESDVPHFIPDTIRAIREFSGSLKSTNSSESGCQRGLAKANFSFGPESSKKFQKVSDEDNFQELEIAARDTTMSLKNKQDDCIVNSMVENAKEPDASNHPVSPSTGSLANKSSDSSFSGPVSYEDSHSSYETNPEFLKVFCLRDAPSPVVSPRQSNVEHNFQEPGEDSPDLPDEEAVPQGSTTEKDFSIDVTDHMNDSICSKPPRPSVSKFNTSISELARIPRGSINRRNSEPPTMSAVNVRQDETGSCNAKFLGAHVNNSIHEVVDIFPIGEVRWPSQVEETVSPLKSRLPDHHFSPKSSLEDASTRQRGTSMPEFERPEDLQADESGQQVRSSVSNNLDGELSQKRRISTCSGGSDVFLEDEDDKDNYDKANVIHDKELLLTEHVQNVSMNAIQEFNTLLSSQQDGEFCFDLPLSASSLQLTSPRGGHRPGSAVASEASDWLNQSLPISEETSNGILDPPFSMTAKLSMDNSDLVTTQSSGLSSERSRSTSTTHSESDGELLRWKKGNILGKGAFGVVYCGLTNTGQLIAVKQVELREKDNLQKSREQYMKLQEEVELLKTLRHKNIVGFLGVSLESSIVNIFMQFIPGGSIASLLARFGTLEEPVFCRYTKEILQGAEYLHEKNVIHRDIKGANIMLMSNGVIKLIDFGCAKRLCINIGQSQNLLKSMRGTPYWMAPEVIMETGHGKKSDIWSIGCTVFEMATRKPPWSDMPPVTAMFSIGKGGSIPQLPERFSTQARKFVSVCLTRDQNERPTATQLLTHNFIMKCRDRGPDCLKTRISSSTIEEGNITFKEQPATSQDVSSHRKMARVRKRDLDFS